MEISFLTLKNKTAKFKASVHATGKLNFSPDCKEMENFENTKYFKVGIDSKNKKNICLVVAEENEENIIKLSKSGKSLYLNFSDVLNELKIDFIKNNILFEVSKMEEQFNHKDVYSLIKIDSQKREKRESKKSNISEQVF